MGNKRIEDRKTHTIMLIAELIYLAKEYPDLRFNQILENFDFVKLDSTSDYYTEPRTILERVQAKIKMVKG